MELPDVSLSSQSEKPAETEPEPGSAETGPSENKNPPEEPAARDTEGDQRVQEFEVDSETRDRRNDDSAFEEISSLEVRRTQQPDCGPKNPTKESRKSPAGKSGWT